MIPVGGIAAVVLAAGESSRMGKTKPLLPLGSRTAIERLVDSATRSQIRDIVVVTGYRPDVIAPTLNRLPARQIHNDRYESGMFSSVLAGVSALADGAEGFFILPADYALMRPQVLRQLMEVFHQGGCAILHPTCCGIRGHPPLLREGFRDALLEARDLSSLEKFFRQHADDESEVEVEDLTVLLDMDTSEDYRRLSRFAGFLDNALDSSAPGESGSALEARETHYPLLSFEDAIYLLSLLQVPGQVVQHCQVVASVGESLGWALKPRVPALNVDLIRTAGLIHDMAKALPRHAVAAQNILQNLGLQRLGTVVGAHMVLPVEQLETPLPTEEQVVYLADKLVIEDRVTGIEARAARALSRHGGDATAVERVRRRISTARTIQERIETIIQRPLEEVLRREIRAST
jgi:CTP:molybdopterin cytidylyltransferase MocA